SGGDRDPAQRGVAVAHQQAIAVEEVDRLGAGERVAVERGMAVPRGHAEAATIFGPAPDDADATAEVLRRVGPPRVHHLAAVAHLDALDRRSRGDVEGKPR